MKRLWLCAWVGCGLILFGCAAPLERVEISLPEGAVARYGLGMINTTLNRYSPEWNLRTNPISYSADGKYLAVAKSIGAALRRGDTLELARILPSRGYGALCVAFSPDGSTLAWASGDKTIELWDSVSQEHMHTLTGHEENVFSVGFAEDGKNLASASADGTIKVWDVASGSLLSTLSGHADALTSMAFSPDGTTLASGEADGRIELWNAATGELTNALARHADRVSSVAFSPNGKRLASASRDGTIVLWDLVASEVVHVLTGHANVVTSVAFSPDGKTLASGSLDKMIILWDIATGEPTSTFSGHTDPVLSVVFAPDGVTLASVSARSLRFWDVATGKLAQTLTGRPGHVVSLAISPDGKTLASASFWDTVDLWNVATDELVNTLAGHEEGVVSTAFSPDGKILASASWDKTIILWDVATGELIHALTGHARAVRSVSFSPDGKTLASGSDDGTIKLWSVPTTELARTLAGGAGSVYPVAFSPDGRTLGSAVGPGEVVASGDVVLWDVQAGEPTGILTRCVHVPDSVAFSPDWKTLASGSGLGRIELLDLATGELVNTLTGHEEGVISTAFSPDGKILASGAFDRRVILWDVETGKSIRILTGHSDVVNSVAFFPDGDTLASGSRDGTILLWDLTGIEGSIADSPQKGDQDSSAAESEKVSAEPPPQSVDGLSDDASGSANGQEETAAESAFSDGALPPQCIDVFAGNANESTKGRGIIGGGGYYYSVLTIAPRCEIASDGTVAVALDGTAVTNVVVDRQDPGGLALLNWSFDLMDMDSPAGLVRKVTVYFDSGGSAVSEQQGLGTYVFSLPDGASHLAALEVNWSWGRNDHTLTFELRAGVSPVESTGIGWTDEPSSRTSLQIQLERTQDIVDFAQQETAFDREMSTRQVVTMLSPYEDESPEVAEADAIFRQLLEREELIRDSELESVIDKILTAADRATQLEYWHALRAEVFDRATHLAGLMPNGQLASEDAARLANIAKYGAQEVDDISAPFPAEASSVTDFLKVAHGLATMADNLEDPDAEKIMDGLRDLLDPLPGMSTNPLTAILDVPGEVFAAMVNVTRDGLQEITRALENIGAAISGDPNATERAIGHSRNVQRIISSENYAKSMMNAVSNRIVDKIPFARTVVAWFIDE